MSFPQDPPVPIPYDVNCYPLRPIDFTPAARFIPPENGSTPQSLFTAGDTTIAHGGRGRFLRYGNYKQLLIYADGACPNNGQLSAVGGCAFVFKGGINPWGINIGVMNFRLEDRGPSGVAHRHTSNRAELRAVLAALQFFPWNRDGYTELVIATDSDYVVSGATQLVAGWVTSGWRTSSGRKVKNMDLWESLFQEIQRFKLHPANRIRVLFWWIPREWNAVADQAAKEAAASGEPKVAFTKICGGLES